MATSGIRQGKARFGDDVRERARKAIEGRMRMKERTEREPPVKAKPAAKKPAAKPTAKPAAKKTAPARTNVKQERMDREPPVRTKPKLEMPPPPKPKSSAQFGPRMTFPRDVGTDKAAEARRKMFEGNSPVGDLMEMMRGKKGTGGQMARNMKKGGMTKAKKGFRK